MKTLKLTGTIMPKGWDLFAPKELVDAGMIAPTTSIIKELDALAEGEECEVYVSSGGGSTFCGAEIVIALRNAIARGAKLSVEVGAEACSMAASFVAAAAVSKCKVKAHANSMIMFHSCFCDVEGGPQLHEDVAALLRGVNQSTIEDLKALGITDCRAWFAEAREKWLTAANALDMGLVGEIAETDAAKAEFDDAMRGQLAAWKHDREIADAVDAAVKAESAKTAKAVEDAIANVRRECQEQFDANAQEMANGRFAKLQSAHDKLIAEKDSLIKSLTGQNSTLEAGLANAKAKADADAITHADAVAKLEAGLAGVRAEADTLRNQLAAEKKAHEEVVKGALKPSPAKQFTSNRERIASGMKIVSE